LVKLQNDKLISKLPARHHRRCHLTLLLAECHLLVGVWGRVVVTATKTMPSRSASILRQPQQLHTSREYMITGWVMHI
jgi:hypothetical protein